MRLYYSETFVCMSLYYSDTSSSQSSNPTKHHSYISVVYKMAVGKGGVCVYVCVCVCVRGECRLIKVIK